MFGGLSHLFGGAAKGVSPLVQALLSKFGQGGQMQPPIAMSGMGSAGAGIPGAIGGSASAGAPGGNQNPWGVIAGGIGGGFGGLPTGSKFTPPPGWLDAVRKASQAGGGFPNGFPGMGGPFHSQVEPPPPMAGGFDPTGGLGGVTGEAGRPPMGGTGPRNTGTIFWPPGSFDRGGWGHTQDNFERPEDLPGYKNHTQPAPMTGGGAMTGQAGYGELSTSKPKPNGSTANNWGGIF